MQGDRIVLNVMVFSNDGRHQSRTSQTSEVTMVYPVGPVERVGVNTSSTNLVKASITIMAQTQATIDVTNTELSRGRYQTCSHTLTSYALMHACTHAQQPRTCRAMRSGGESMCIWLGVGGGVEASECPTPLV
ncbi:unnamed protein product [Mesocestoides corti]|uniref:Uncharacterized protein n=2 Tax=Mesocestoides corti TaxID=53468 RepID=A0A0R3U589_MESCO|nr:unnamed protein product [Mesocestoides corti]